MSSKPTSRPPASTTTSRTQQGSLFILRYNSRRVLVPTPNDYDKLQVAIRRHFPEIPVDDRVSYHTDDLLISRGMLVEVSADIWQTAIPLLNRLIVESSPKAAASRSSKKRRVKEEPKDGECDSSCNEGPSTKPPAKKSRIEPAPPSLAPASTPGSSKTVLTILKGDEDRFQIMCRPSTHISTIYRGIQDKLGHEAHDWNPVWEGCRFGDSTPGTVESFGMRDGDHIYLFEVQRAGKPVIYLFPPSQTEVDASVKLSLVPEWRFSGIYPAVPVGCPASGGQTLQWDVKTLSDGTLLEKNTGLEVAYLFWEAEALALPEQMPPSGAHTALGPIATEETFLPTHAQLEPSNSIVVEVAKVTPYLDRVLKTLGLHTEARTSFITYWLPAMLKHTHVALRFLPQRVYERAAPLDVTPTPDVVVRVFMLFKGLKPGEVSVGSDSGWHVAVGDDDVDRWTKVVGTDKNRSLTDENLFRVLEWGGMEQLSTDETFVPTHPRLSPDNSVVLEVAKLTPYLDSALKALGLRVEARTSFITYWLPSFLKHTHVALRFLPQTSYEHSAPLEVEPKPDVVVRVFMLFKGLKKVDLSAVSKWHAALNASDVNWRTVVGLGDNHKLDAKLFRVVEWGGMEVLS